MLTFIDGPAQGASDLCVQRAPLYLRVVRGADGQWDALDQLTDSPRVDEKVYAYRRVGRAGSVHVDRARERGGRGRQGPSWWKLARYQLVGPQPDEAVLRDTQAWQAWCREQVRPAPGPGEGEGDA